MAAAALAASSSSSSSSRRILTSRCRPAHKQLLQQRPPQQQQQRRPRRCSRGHSLTASATVAFHQPQQHDSQQAQTTVATSPRLVDGLDATALSEEYTRQMQHQMGWSEPYAYHFDRGLYLHEVHPRLFCGTQPRSPAEVEVLAKRHGVGTILNLQQDKDIAHWGVDFAANEAAARGLGVRLVRTPARDFDPHSLRKMLPVAVRQVNDALQGGQRVYVHCTAGLGRAPAVCIAWLYWYGPFLALDEAYSHLTSVRPCGPNRDAIRGATFDLLDARPFGEFERLPSRAWAFLSDQDRARLQAQLAGLRS